MDAALSGLGLSTFFTAQLSAEEIESDRLARIVEVQRARVVADDGAGEWTLTLGGSWYRLAAEQRPTVGDWVVLDAARERVLRLLERRSVFRRVAAGSRADVQLIAANVDTLFVVTSCNDEFNESRLERYLALALEAGVDPVVVLTKADLAIDAERYRERARAVRAGLAVELVDALAPGTLDGVRSWIGRGSTVALVGSSGVGKSTLVNSLAGTRVTATAAIREQDAKGRHTTSYRALHRLPDGGLLLDVPGMRELQVAQLETSLSDVYADVETLAGRCRFRDCDHEAEPGCAVRAAIADGELDPRRLANYRKLAREQARNSATLAEQRHQARRLGKVYKQHQEAKLHLDGKDRRER